MFVEEWDPTVEDSHRKRVVVDGETGMMEILDTAGKEEFSSLIQHNVAFGDGFLLVFDLTNRDSLDGLSTYHDYILEGKGPHAAVVLCGNKCDLEGSRVIAPAEANQLAKLWGCPYVEASAKGWIHVEDAFFQVVRAIRRGSLGPVPPKSKRTNCSLF
eukprot:CAMPEP_0174256410 /NCGR_PEP_ID=MMETSP0439-20130205/5649_1 /TAXON_ID=0 /ORGANISM="Stereomyxa ramosa, Strain Chinc5" /LENGTH=157 /DNA_ID=CAMNT_0015339003 /DNA_START=21 /DNA_END=494 /DNA_ORIENTATION=-